MGFTARWYTIPAGLAIQERGGRAAPEVLVWLFPLIACTPLIRGPAPSDTDEDPRIRDDAPIHQVLGDHRSRVAGVNLDDDVFGTVTGEVALSPVTAKDLGTEQNCAKYDGNQHTDQRDKPAAARPLLRTVTARRSDGRGLRAI